MPSRRRFLAACATSLAGALAGCVETDGAMFVTPVPTDSDVAVEATVAAAGPDRRRDIAALVPDAADGGTEVAGERAPFQPERPVAHHDAVYDVRWEQRGTVTRTAYRIVATAQADAPGEPTMAFDELPEADRRALFSIQDTLEDVDPEGDGFETSEQRYYDRYDREASVVVPEPEHDLIEMAGYEVALEVEPVDAELDLYRYEAARVADSMAAFGADLRETYQFALAGLDDEERSLFEEAIAEGSYYAGSGDTSTFEAVGERFVSQPAIYSERREGGEWLAEYDGDAYWVRFDFVRMEDLADRVETAGEVGRTDEPLLEDDWAGDEDPADDGTSGGSENGTDGSVGNGTDGSSQDGTSGSTGNETDGAD